MQFDLSKLMEDPNFISGIGLLGSSSKQTEPLLTAYQMLRQHSQAKQAGAFKQQEAERDRLDSESTREHRKAQIEVDRAKAVHYGEQVKAQQRELEEAVANRQMFMRLFNLNDGNEQPAMSPQQPQSAPVMPPTPQFNVPRSGPTNLGEAGMRNQVNTPMGPDPQALTREIVATQQDLLRVPDAGSRAMLSAHLADLKKQQANLNTQVVNGSPEKATQQKNIRPGYMPEFTLDEKGGLKITAKPNYEQQRIGLDAARLNNDTTRLGHEGQRVQHDAARVGLEGERVDIARDAVKVDRDKEGRVAAGAERERLAATAQDWRTFTTNNANLDNLSRKISELDKHAGLPRIFGMVGAIPDMPGSPAADARAKHTSVVKQIAKETLQSIRDASKTGGALGNVSDKDIELLETAVENLGAAQSTESARKAMKDVQQYSTRLRNIAMESFERTHGKNPIEGLPTGARIAGTDPKTGKTFYRLPDSKFVMEK